MTRRHGADRLRFCGGQLHSAQATESFFTDGPGGIRRQLDQERAVSFRDRLERGDGLRAQIRGKGESTAKLARRAPPKAG